MSTIQLESPRHGARIVASGAGSWLRPSAVPVGAPAIEACRGLVEVVC